jgi:hypothetical protein
MSCEKPMPPLAAVCLMLPLAAGFAAAEPVDPRYTLRNAGVPSRPRSDGGHPTVRA